VKFATYLHDSKEYVGVLSNCGTAIYPISDFGLEYKSMVDLIENITEKERQHLAKQLDAPEYAGLPVDDVELLAAIPKPRDIIAVSQNYVTHVMETCSLNGVEYVRPKYCSYFWRRVNRAVAHNGNICLHAGISSMLDYEVELAVVIGKECSRVAEKDALDYVFGYTISNDITARDIQNNLPQYAYAKGLDDTTPIGPYIVTADEIKDPHNLHLSLKVNGELRQNGNTNDFIFNIPYVISDITKGMTLFPGDIIITGTPSGIGAGMNPPVFLKHGDIIESEIEGIGILRNIVE
jgi:2-keto-4-pentenoate hydratase/2-oxohepta-3-ene-1,7-dioic acid hydratase in catechol pathway